ncbi:MAG: VWA domain-containing protein, partial [Planctomycetota bacterium]|nr:VWA domain-containing protein [Planctomycetota bacterium]
MPDRAPDRRRHRLPPRRPPPAVWAILAVLPFLWHYALPAVSGEAGRISAVLLNRDLGDPRAPGNVKIALTLPVGLEDRLALARAEDFLVHVYPAGAPSGEVLNDSHLAGGIYLWRSGGVIFLDARLTPAQERSGPAEVRVAYAPEGTVLAEGLALGELSLASELADVVLAVDVSQSMSYNDPRRRRVAAARTFVEVARRGGGVGKVGLITFNTRAEMNVPLLPLEMGERIMSALGGIGARDMTNLDEPLRLGLSELAAAGSGRPVIILLTDGKNEGYAYRNAHLDCARAGVRIFTVGLTRHADHRLLREMAEKTGGIYFQAPRDEDLPEIYARLAAELGKRRLLHGETLDKASGEIVIPVDAGLRRLAALADGGAVLTASGPDGKAASGTGAGGVHLVVPAPGDWRVAWRGASPGQSALTVSGDTTFFLDLFPPH